MDIDYRNGYIARKDGHGDSYNYNLSRMISNFSFYDYCDSVRRRDFDNNGAALVISSSQYVVGYNAAYGRGTHEGALARIYKELHGGGVISGDSEAIELYKKCQNEYVTARIIYESIELNMNRPLFEGMISFYFVQKLKENKNISITGGMMESFKRFYEDYNDEIKLVCKNYKFKVVFSYVKDGKIIKDVSKSLDNLYNFLETLVDKEREEIPDETIVGISYKSEFTK